MCYCVSKSTYIFSHGQLIHKRFPSGVFLNVRYRENRLIAIIRNTCTIPNIVSVLLNKIKGDIVADSELD